MRLDLALGVAAQEVLGRAVPEIAVVGPGGRQVPQALPFQQPRRAEKPGQRPRGIGPAGIAEQEDLVRRDVAALVVLVRGDVVLGEKQIGGADDVLDARPGGPGDQPFQLRAAGAHATQVDRELRHPVAAGIGADGAGQADHVGLGPFTVGGVPGSVEADDKAFVHGAIPSPKGLESAAEDCGRALGMVHPDPEAVNAGALAVAWPGPSWSWQHRTALERGDGGAVPCRLAPAAMRMAGAGVAVSRPDLPAGRGSG